MEIRAVEVLLRTLTIAALILTATTAVGEDSGGTAKVSVWSGIYTAAQSKRGETVHRVSCAFCHGPTLNGAGQPDMPPSPSIAGADLLRKWSGKTVAELFVYVQKEMPTDNPGSLKEQDTIDSIAHMFAVSEIPAGDKELPPDANTLANIIIEQQKKK